MPESSVIEAEMTTSQATDILLEPEEVDEEIDYELLKSRPSFKCLIEPEISRSSIFADKYYYFPDIPDPELEFALWGPEPKETYDFIGTNKYKKLCKEEGIFPFRRVLASFTADVLDLKFYGIRDKEMKALCGALEINSFITSLLLEENYLTPTALRYLVSVLDNNQSISTLSMKHCQIGPDGAEILGDIFMQNSYIKNLDLSFNSLGDRGLAAISEGIRFNISIKYLNLSHNDLGDDAFVALRFVVQDNFTIVDLDLSWNYLYKPKGMMQLMEGLIENMKIESLNLAWNGIGDKLAVRSLVKYLRTTNRVKLNKLNLSNNRFTGIPLKMLHNGLRQNTTVTHLNLANNPVTPYEIEDFATLLLGDKSALIEIDFGDAWVKKSFLKIKEKIEELNKVIHVGGTYSNYKIHGPNVKEVLLKRAKYVAMKQKKKKLRKDFGEWLMSFAETEDQFMDREIFEGLIKKAKIKLDADLIKLIGDNFSRKSKINIKSMIETYLKLFPDTKAKEKKKKKGKKKGKKGKKKEKAAKTNVKEKAKE